MIQRTIACITLSVSFFAAEVCAQTVVDDALKVEKIAEGFDQPTGMAFLPGSNDALVLEKSTGKVRLLRDGAIVSTALTLNVETDSERGLLGIALHPKFTSNHFVYLYYTASSGGNVINRIDRFVWEGTKLALDRRIKSLPGTPGPNHDGGKIEFGPDGKLYAVIGDLNNEGKTENFSRVPLNATASILRLNDNGSSPRDNPFFESGRPSSQRILNDIYAYGVRNSFGLAFDPITGDLWDTENGPDQYDEINRIFSGFNSGWKDRMGPKSRVKMPVRLTKLGDNARYADPMFSWKHPVAPTDLVFNHAAGVGRSYRNDLFVGDFELGQIYHLELGPDRKQLALTGDLADRVVDNTFADLNAEQESLIFGQGFGIVTELIARNDGMYVLSLDQGAVYRISEAEGALAGLSISAAPEPSALLIGAAIAMGLASRRQRTI